MNWINPILIKLGPVSIHWYGLMYVLTFVFAYLFLKFSAPGKKLPLDELQKDNLLISIILGIILGGRIGYILFYNLPYYLQNPAKILAVWEGGLSFHGGLIGTILAIIIYIMTHNRLHPDQRLHFLPLADIAALIAPIGIMLGRIGNFINGELYGRINNSNQICFYFPSDQTHCRFPSQLFESLGEGLLLFSILFYLSKKTSLSKHPGLLGGLFLTIYGLIRFLIEFTREPDAQIGYLLGGPEFLQGITMGQLLSLLTTIAGIITLLLVKKTTRSKSHPHQSSSHSKD